MPNRDRQGKISGFSGFARNVTEQRHAEKALQESKEQLSMLFTSMTNGFALHEVIRDPSGKVIDYIFLDVNPAYEKFTGLSRETVIGKTVKEILPNTEDFWIANFGEIATTGVPKNLENYSGELGRWYAVYAYRFAPEQFAVMVQDISERKQAEGALLESEARLDELAQLSRIWTWEVNAQGLYTYASHIVTDVLGYQPEEMVGKMHFYDLHPEAGRAAFKLAALDIFARKQPFVNLTNFAETKDGSLVWLSTNGIPRLNAEGVLIGYRGSDTDITERKKTEEALRESEDQFRTIAAFAHDAIVILDANGTIAFWNPAAETIFGYKKDEAIGNGLLHLLAPEHKLKTFDTELFRFWNSSQGAPVGRKFELDALRKDGSEVAIELSVSAVKRKNQWIAISIIRDISANKAHQTELELVANYDSLTGLPNRRLLSDRLHQAIVRSRRGRTAMAVCYLDLDDFKPVNDRYGHEIGDQVLVDMANNLKGTSINYLGVQIF